MYARITKYRMKPDSIGAATALVERIKPQIMGLQGMQHFLNVADIDDGSGYVISIVTDKAASDANQEKVKEIWAQFAQHLAEPPAEAEGYEVLFSWPAG